jgi:phosphoribosylformylglycinamidine synthase
MKFGVITFPGSNCDRDVIYVIRHQLKAEVVNLWYKDRDLQNCDFIILPGGFSYGDYLRSGAIARFAPIMNEVIAFAKRGGYVLGICNGFQILCEAGLLPGALLHNLNRKFICDNVYIAPVSKKAPITSNLNRVAYKIPIAHGEGRFFAPDEIIKQLEDQDRILFKYCNTEGNITSESNPNGSLNNIAGICSENFNVMGMMPHPERAADECLYNTDGLEIFREMLSNCLETIR